MQTAIIKSLTLLLLTFFTGNCLLSQETKYKITVSYGSNIMPVGDKYVLELNDSERKIIDTGHRMITFSKLFNAGEPYVVRLISSPREANFLTYTGNDSVARGTVSNDDISIYLNAITPLTILKLNIFGIEEGETFYFADEYGRSLQTSFNFERGIGGFPKGDYYIFKQTGGPRACKLTNGQGIVPDSSITIQCDCSKPFTPPPPPANTYDLISRSSDNKILSTYYESWSPVISGKNENEGRFVAFVMYGKGIDGSSGNYRHVFWRDRKEGITKLVSKNAAGEEGNGNSFSPSISADGRSIVFETYATNLSGGDNNGVRDVYHWNQTNGQLTLISKSTGGQTANGESYEPVISGDGNTVAYTSGASNIVTLEPVFNTPNVYVYDVRSGSSSFITKDYETGKAAGGYAPAISDDGGKIAFCAFTNRLVKGDNNNLWDIFLWQKGTPGLKRISVPGAGAERDQGDESSSRVVWPSISGDGNSIVFATTSTTLAGDDRNGLQDIFLYNTGTNGIKRVSTLNNITEGDGNSPISQGERIGISYDGKWITYNTNATNFGVPKGNIVVQNTTTGKIIPATDITIGSTGRPMLSRHGYFVAAGCSEPYDKRFASSGLFTFYINLNQ
jgi:Tol biopolymer transport system component